MREIDVKQVQATIEELIEKANFELPEEVLDRIKLAQMREYDAGPKGILGQIVQNAEIARKKRLPLCQDCGITVIFMEIGQEVHFTGGDLNEAITEAVRQAYKENLLRNSVVKSPLKRVNTGDNTPPVVHQQIVSGDRVRIEVMIKGGGCENMSYTKMLTPAQGIEGIKQFVLESVEKSGANPCPPIVVGIGLGGNFERAAHLAKKSLLRKLGSKNPVDYLEKLEEELLEEINNLGIGPQGFGGLTTALGVHILEAPCHIASLPVALNIECHSHRHKEAEI